MSRYLLIFALALQALFPMQAIGQWTVLPTGTTSTFYNMTAVDDMNLYGFGTTFVKSTDGSASWSVLTPNTVSSWVNAGFFINPMVGWIGGKYGAVGGEILKTTDGGQTWVSQHIVQDIGINDFHFNNAQIGWAASFGGLIQYTSDGGTNWTNISNIAEEVENIQFVSNLEGWAITYNGNLLHSTDGGVNWTTELSNRGYGLHFRNANEGWITGRDGEVYQTTDGGGNWTMRNTNFNKPLTSIYFADALHGWAVGGIDCRTAGCIPYQQIIATTDGGQSWYPQTMNGSSTAQFNRVCFGQTVAYTCGNGGQVIKLQTTLTGRETQPAQASIEAWPNPATASVKVRIPEAHGAGEIRIFSATGKTVLQTKYEVGEHTIDLAALPGGMYFLQFRNADYQSSQRLLKH